MSTAPCFFPKSFFDDNRTAEYFLWHDRSQDVYWRIYCIGRLLNQAFRFQLISRSSPKHARRCLNPKLTDPTTNHKIPYLMFTKLAQKPGEARLTAIAHLFVGCSFTLPFLNIYSPQNLRPFRRPLELFTNCSRKLTLELLLPNI